MTERAIQNALFERLSLRGYSLACPNYTPAGWWECDLFGVTKAGLAVEYEIKLTRADFKADAGKAREATRAYPRGGGFETIPAAKKHDRLALADPHGPSRFYYVVPAGMVGPDEVPEWAGLIYVGEYKRFSTVAARLTFHDEKPAPRLHREKVPATVIDHCKGVFYYRFWNLRRGITEDSPEASGTTPRP